jgi:pimeloyl-ACP methyl ester carboxylesterase
MRAIGTHLPAGWRELVDPRWLEGWEPKAFELEGGTTQLTMGKSPPLVLVPPLPGFKEAFLGIAHLLARDFRVITFDLRASFAGRPGWPALVADLDRVLQQVAPGRVALLGHSLGGAVAQHWALEHPQQALILLGGPRVSKSARHWSKRYWSSRWCWPAAPWLGRAGAGYAWRKPGHTITRARA